MKIHLVQIYNRLRASYWFLPAVMTVGAIVLSIVTIYVDNRLGGAWIDALDWLPANRPEGARSVLSSISGSMITVAGVTFSMTLVSVSFASAQFGPRLVGNFMRDTGNQVTLGVFIATFVYCLMVLRTVRSAYEASTDGAAVEAFVPHVSLLCALGLTLASVAVLIYFIHHIPETIDVSNIISKVGRDLDDRIARRFPKDMGNSAREVDPANTVSTELPGGFFDRAIPILADRCGYVEAVDESGLMELATEHDLVIRLQYRAGDFVIRGKPLLLVDPRSGGGPGMDPELVRKLGRSLAFSRERSPSQNLMFLVDELVEIMARALSPGVNDPFTAINCMQWLQQATHTMATSPQPDPRRLDEQGQLRVLTYPVDFAAFCKGAFGQSLPYVASDRNAALEMMRLLGELVVSLPDGPQRQLLLQYATALEAAGSEALGLEADRVALKARHTEVQQLVNTTGSQISSELDRSDWLRGSA